MFSSNTSSAEGGYQISRSLRFNAPDGAYLNRTPASAGNRKTWTWSAWIKRAGAGENFAGTRYAFIFTAGTIDTNDTTISFINDKLNLSNIASSLPTASIRTTAVYRDFSAWYHIVVAWDTTQATAANRVKIYVNGVEVTAFDTSTYPNQNTDSAGINTTATQYLGVLQNTAFNIDSYMTEVNFIDGQALTPSSFGETNAQTGVWQPKAYTGTYGTNGFYLNFSDNSNTTAATLGKDYSGNGNNWTPNNFSVTAGAGNDSLVDTPTPYGVDTGAGGTVRGNYATLNPLNNAASLFNGNLDSGTASAIANWLPTSATLGVSSGKWYWEVRMNSAEYLQVGIFPITYAATSGTYPGSASTSGYGYQSANGNKYVLGTGSSYGATFTTGDVIGVALDLDAGTLVFYKNNVSQGTAASSISGTFVPGIAVYNSTGASTVANCNFGQRPFAYTAPSGFKALCTQNLPTPTIGATSTTQAGKYFNPVLYTGTGSTLSVTGVGFQPDFVWVKKRSSSSYGHVLVDAVRGASLRLFSNTTDGESSGGGGNTVSAFNSDGFTVLAGSDVNDNGGTFVGWNWKANGAGSSNTAGSITSTVSANTTSGFSIVTFTASANSGSIGHGLGVAPNMIIIKSRNNTSNWVVYHSSLGADKYLNLNTTDAAITNTATWQNTTPTSTVFYSNGPFATGWTEVAYCFAEVPGYSKFGSYTGNGSTDGPFVFTGMRPAFVMLKNTTTAGNAWHMIDTARGTYNVYGPSLDANASSAEITYTICDLLSNGFKLRDTNQAWNKSGDVYIFMAFASNPFKFALAR